MKNNGLKNGINTRYKKGNTPFNKGKRGITTGGISTQFKKGQKSINYKPIGTERIDDGGYLISDDADLTKTGIIIAEIYAKMSERKKQKGD